MDFSFTEEQDALKELARQILEDKVTQERLRQIEATEDGFDRELWLELAKSNLLGAAVPEAHGGLGLGFLALALLLEQVGRTVAPIPVLPALVLGALPVAKFGTPAQQAAELPGVVGGNRILTAALNEVGTDPAQPATTAKPDGGGWRLDGVKICIPAGLVADRILVPARTGEGTIGVFLVNPKAPGVTLQRQVATDGQVEARMELGDVRVGADDVLGDPAEGANIVEWMVERATAAMCFVAVGVCEKALQMTAEYVKTRQQFDRIIATFQAVGQRAADAYIDTEAVRLTAWQAAWRISEELPAATEIAVAKFWAADGGQRVVHAAQHLHGGMGVDRDYPLHRYFLWAKHLELSLGGATVQLLRLGAMMANQTVEVG